MALSAAICDQLGWGAEKPRAVDAARLLKADLATEMVKEFTSLQGIMGGIYAREEGAPEEVWQAIYDQYLPASAEDRTPRGRAGQVVGLADRMDTLVGIFGLGLIPTGSKDPFGLRRAAQGVVRIALEGGLPSTSEQVAGRGGAPLRRAADPRRGGDPGATCGPSSTTASATCWASPATPTTRSRRRSPRGSPACRTCEARVDALHGVRGEADFLSVVLAAKRIANIVKDAAEAPFDEGALVEPAEKELAAAFEGLRADIEAAAAAGDYERGLRRIAGLAPVLDRFFVEVMVMAEDPGVRAQPRRPPPGDRPRRLPHRPADRDGGRQGRGARRRAPEPPQNPLKSERGGDRSPPRRSPTANRALRVG